MSKRMLVLLVVLITFTTLVHPVAAQGPGFGEIYVDPSRNDGNEDGTKANPYNEEDEGRAYLQSLPQGGDLYIKKADGTWEGPIAVDPAKAGISGLPFPKSTMYLLLGVVALVLILTGWFLQKRSQSMER